MSVSCALERLASGAVCRGPSVLPKPGFKCPVLPTVQTAQAERLVSGRAVVLVSRIRQACWAGLQQVLMCIIGWAPQYSVVQYRPASLDGHRSTVLCSTDQHHWMGTAVQCCAVQTSIIGWAPQYSVVQYRPASLDGHRSTVLCSTDQHHWMGTAVQCCAVQTSITQNAKVHAHLARARDRAPTQSSTSLLSSSSQA